MKKILESMGAFLLIPFALCPPLAVIGVAYVIEQVFIQPDKPRLAYACEVNHTCDEERDERDPAYISPF